MKRFNKDGIEDLKQLKERAQRSIFHFTSRGLDSIFASSCDSEGFLFKCNNSFLESER